MSSSKVILVGAVSVVFGLYSLSITRVGGYVGNTAENILYISKANDNAKTGVQRCLNAWSRVVAPTNEVLQLLDGSYNYTVSTNKTWFSGYVVGDTVRMTITSHGIYKAVTEPAAFQGHEVIRTAFAKFRYPGVAGWYDVIFVSAFDSVNYGRERQLDSLQGYKNNLLGY